MLYPEAGFTKGELIDAYADLAEVLLPHLRGRPVTLKRYPDGVEGKFFYEKRSPKHRPDWVATARIWSESHKAEIDYTLIEDLPTLVWAANLANIELHTALARVDDLDRPDSLVFDLDPGAPADVLDCARVALRLRGALRPARPRLLREDLRLQGPPPARAAERHRDLRPDPALRQGGRRGDGGALPRGGRLAPGEGAARRAGC